MSYQPVRRQSRVCVTQRSDDVRKGVVLRGFIGKRVDSFEFHADRKVIAGSTAVIARWARMPGSVGEFDELRQSALPGHQ